MPLSSAHTVHFSLAILGAQKVAIYMRREKQFFKIQFRCLGMESMAWIWILRFRAQQYAGFENRKPRVAATLTRTCSRSVCLSELPQNARSCSSTKANGYSRKSL